MPTGDSRSRRQGLGRGWLRQTCSILPLARSEQRGADADQCRALFDRDLEILTHAHRKLLQIDIGRLHRIALVPQIAQLLKVGPCLFRVLEEWRYHHQTLDSD